MLDVERWAEIRRLHLQEKLSRRQIARRLGIDPKTVKRALALEHFVPRRRPAPRGSRLDPCKPVIQLYLRESPELSAVQILDRLRRDRQYAGAITTVRAYVATLRQSESEAFLRLTHLPGKAAQVDWAYCGPVRIGDTVRRLSLFVMVLAYSRCLYAEYTLSERMDAFLEAHRRAFDFFGGIPGRIVYDNCKTVVLDRRGGQIRLHPRLLEFSAHALFAPRPCPPRRPWHKGIVENSIRYLRTSFLAGRPPVTDLERERHDLFRWLTETANVRLHATTRRRPVELLAEERAALIPLPTTPLDTAHTDTVAANAFFEVHFDGNRYTVPPRYARREGLLLRATGRDVALFDGAIEIARHPRSFQRGQRISDPSHERSAQAGKRRAENDRLLGRLRDLLGEQADGYAAGLVRREVRSERHLRRILGLADRYGASEVRDALRAGLAHNAFGADYVENVIHQRRRARRAPPLLPVCVADELAGVHVPEPDLSHYPSFPVREAERSPDVDLAPEGSAPATGGESAGAEPDADRAIVP